MELRDISIDDLSLYEALLTDPDMMSELGGPLPSDQLPDKLSRIVAEVRDGTVWYDVIVSDGRPAGTICIWTVEEGDQRFSEIGWMVLPAFQGQGLASGAVHEYVARARTQGRWDVLHAHPGVTNGPSNAICRRTGFELVGERDIEYMGRTLRCNRWVLDLRDGA